VLVGALDGSAFVVEANEGLVSRRLPQSPRPILAVASLSKPGLVATGGGDGVVRVMRVEDGTVIEEYKNPFGPVWALAIRPVTDGQPISLYYGGLDDFATLWQASPRKPFDAVDASAYPRRFQQAGKPDTAIGRGEIQFARKCSICHTLTPDGANRAGPTLHQVFGRRIATRQGYAYSPELKTLNITWSAETIAKLFELGPDKFTPGSKMPLQVMSEKSDRDDLIAFLEIATREAKPLDPPVDASPPTAPQPQKR
jgi:cytochrome c